MSTESDKTAESSTVPDHIFSKWMVSALFVVVILYLSRPLYDPDFYWHLKTGQWIWNHQALPYHDPFGIPPHPEQNSRFEFILTSYWLIQLILYGCYTLFGMSGIILFRIIIATGLFFMFARWTNIRNSAAVSVVTLGTMLLLEFYFIERPQFLSFVFFAMLLTVLFKSLYNKSTSFTWSTPATLSLIMICWSNMHGGFFIGQAVLIYFVVSEGMKFIHKNLEPLSVQQYKMLCISSAAALAASCINPNAINLLKYLPIIFDSKNYANQNILEELSLYRYFLDTSDYTIVIYALSMVATLFALLTSHQRKNITWAGLLFGTAFMGYQHMRLMPFFMLTAMLFVTKQVGKNGLKPVGLFIISVLLIATMLKCIPDEFGNIAKIARSGLVPTQQYPVKSADYLDKNNLHGNIYTDLFWGGYMLWRAKPEDKIFHDGRMLSIQRIWEYNNISTINPGQRPYWKGIFKRYDVRIAVLPLYEPNGQPNVLYKSMSGDNEWTPVFIAENETVFLKK